LPDPHFRFPPTWINDAASPPGAYREALRELAAVAREINALICDTTAGATALADLTASAVTLRDALVAAGGGRLRTGYGRVPGQPTERAFLDTSPGIGLANPVSPPLRLWVEGEAVMGEAIFGEPFEGPPGHVHGGILAAVVDDVLGAVQSATGHPGMTARLAMHYHRPCKLHTSISFRGELVKVEGRKIFTHATISMGETLCAEADGLFISVDFRAMQARMNAERAGDSTATPA
jgi:acyl-coenzyme A thioesterase PaaI-like protein